MAAYEDGTRCPDGGGDADGQLLDRTDLVRCQRAVWECDDHMLDGGRRAVTGEGEEAQHEVELTAHDRRLQLARSVGQ